MRSESFNTHCYYTRLKGFLRILATGLQSSVIVVKTRRKRLKYVLCGKWEDVLKIVELTAVLFQITPPQPHPPPQKLRSE